MTILRRDISTPLEERRTGTDEDGDPLYDLETTTEGDLVGDRVMRLYWTRAGELTHRPDWGADLQALQSENADDLTVQRLSNRIDRALGGLSLIDDYRATVKRDPTAALRIETIVDYAGDEVEIPPTEV